MEKAVGLIGSLGKTEVESMLNEDKGAEMNCGFCNENYRLSESDLEDILRAETRV